MQVLLSEFLEKTGSDVARYVLDNWQQEKACFVKVRIEWPPLVPSLIC